MGAPITSAVREILSTSDLNGDNTSTTEAYGDDDDDDDDDFATLIVGTGSDGTSSSSSSSPSHVFIVNVVKTPLSHIWEATLLPRRRLPRTCPPFSAPARSRVARGCFRRWFQWPSQQLLQSCDERWNVTASIS